MNMIKERYFPDYVYDDIDTREFDDVPRVHL